MHVLHDKSVVDPGTLEQVKQNEEMRKLDVAFKRQYRHVVGIKILNDQPQGEDPRWAGLGNLHLNKRKK